MPIDNNMLGFSLAASDSHHPKFPVQVNGWVKSHGKGLLNYNLESFISIDKSKNQC